MDFYNFEKYNDVFCFEKLDNDYQPLLKTYKDNYQASLNTFLNEYDENTELRFIESQSYFCNKEISVQKSIVISLEKLDHETFYYVRNRVNRIHSVYTKIQSDPFENKTTAKNSNYDEVLDMHTTAKNFIKFISNRITSLCLINEFLVQRKQELEKPSGTVPEQLIAVETFQFKNNFDKVSENDVYQYFKKELVDKKYLNKEKLEDYLICAFQNNNAPKLKFTFEKITTKRAITQVFYNYYNTKAQKPYSKKKVYVELLTNYFNGYEFKNIDSNFSK